MDPQIYEIINVYILQKLSVYTYMNTTVYFSYIVKEILKLA